MKIFKIEENDANQRLDKFLKKLFPSATRSLIYKINRKDKIKIKSIPHPNPLPKGEGVSQEYKFKKRDNEYKLQVWDEIKIFLSDNEFNELAKIEKPVSIVWDFEKIKLEKKDIVYEDWDLLVINKNPWINVHPWDHKTTESNVISQVHDYLWDKLNSLTFKPSLIHRIDRDTSWILLIWKKKETLTKLVWDFKDHAKVKKIYHALVLWRLSRKEGTITKKLKRVENAQKENKVQVSENWLTAISHYKLLNEYNLNTKEGNVIISEVEIRIETWRMHQIRVHMTSLWNPILWDKTYWDKKINAFLKNNYWLERQALHAWKIEFFHYARNKKMLLEARIKDDIKSFLDKIKNK